MSADAKNGVPDLERQISAPRRFGCSDDPKVGCSCPMPKPRRTRKNLENVCEHGDHPAPAGVRYCSVACAECEALEPPAGRECAGRCGFQGVKNG